MPCAGLCPSRDWWSRLWRKAVLLFRFARCGVDMDLFDKQAAHLAQLAMSPGWFQYARTACGDLESDKAHNGLFAGLRAAVVAILRLSGFKPAQHEIGELQ